MTARRTSPSWVPPNLCFEAQMTWTYTPGNPYRTPVRVQTQNPGREVSRWRSPWDTSLAVRGQGRVVQRLASLVSPGNLKRDGDSATVHFRR